MFADLLIYVVCMGLVVIGSCSLIVALGAISKIRMIISLIFASFPIVAGIWLFISADLRPSDLSGLLKSATEEVRLIAENMKNLSQAVKSLKSTNGAAE